MDPIDTVGYLKADLTPEAKSNIIAGLGSIGIGLGGLGGTMFGDKRERLANRLGKGAVKGLATGAGAGLGVALGSGLSNSLLKDTPINSIQDVKNALIKRLLASAAGGVAGGGLGYYLSDKLLSKKKKQKN